LICLLAGKVFATRGAAQLTDYQQNLVAWPVEVVGQIQEMNENFRRFTTAPNKPPLPHRVTHGMNKDLLR
jgi:hypothetical protein